MIVIEVVVKWEEVEVEVEVYGGGSDTGRVRGRGV